MERPNSHSLSGIFEVRPRSNNQPMKPEATRSTELRPGAWGFGGFFLEPPKKQVNQLSS